MSKPEWGAKRRCTACAASFYDMLHDPIRCPKCGAVYHPDAPAGPRRAAARPHKSWAARTQRAVAAAAVVAAEEREAEPNDTETETEPDDAEDAAEADEDEDEAAEDGEEEETTRDG